MPMYDFECAHGHKFEKVVLMDNRDEPIPCEGEVNQAVFGEEEGEVVDLPVLGPTRVKKVPCILKARRIEISHSHPETLLDYGLCANRDAAREGRYDPDRPSTRGVRK